MKKVKIAEGDYESIEELADYLDDVFMAFDPNLIIHVTEQGTLSIQAENSASIDQISGDASSLFYGYELGRPPGMIIGATKYQGGKVESIKGKSDELTFYVGSDRLYKITFPPGFYSREEAIDEINKQLIEKGEFDAKAEAFGEERISLVSNKYVVTGIGGNMIEIDNVTSVLYDNRKKGSITKQQVSVTGYKNITTGVEIKKGVNDQLTFYVEGKKVEVTLLAASEADQKLSSAEIIKRINKAAEDQGVGTTAKLSTAYLSVGGLMIQSDYHGYPSKMVVDKESTAYDSLFVRRDVVNYLVLPATGDDEVASFSGNFGLEEPTVITAANRTLTGTVDGVDFTLTLDMKSYTKNELMQALNDRAIDQGISLEFQYGYDYKKSTLPFVTVSHTVPLTGQFQLNSTTGLYSKLMKGLVLTEPVLTQGKTERVPEIEGIVKPPEYIETAAIARGQTSLAGMTFTNANNVMTFTMNGQAKEITLLTGTYATAEDFLSTHEAIFQNEGLVASLDGGRLVLKTIGVGSGQKLSGFSGSSHDWLMGKRVKDVPVHSGSIGYKSLSNIRGKYEIPNDFKVNSSNNQLTFTYQQLGTSYDVAVELPVGSYTSASHVAATLEQKIGQALVGHGLDAHSIKVAVVEGTLSIRVSNPGNEYTLNNFSGNLFTELFTKLFTKQETVFEPSVSSLGYTYETPTYLVGRENLLTKELVIHPHINDRLIFDFTMDGAKHTIELKLQAGLYSSEELISELNRSLAEELTNRNLYSNVIQAQLGGVGHETGGDGDGQLVLKVNRVDDGRNDAASYVIDSLRGSAAYTLFYNSLGDASPTFTVGVADLTRGITIEAGVDDVLSFDDDQVEKTITLPAGSYNAEQLLVEINQQLDAQHANVSASYYEGRLKLSSKEVGQISIDGFRGSARNKLLFKMDSRAEDDAWAFQVGANNGNQLLMDKPRMSARLLRINTLMVDDPVRANKALTRIDAAIDKVSSERSHIGAITNRLSHSLNVAQHTAENIVRSESKIRDADLAKEMMNKVKTDILLQANQLMLARASAYPESILALVK